MSVVAEGRSVRERPIIFSGPMVTAILRGEKTQTRRVATTFMEQKIGTKTYPDVADAVFPDGSGLGFIGWSGHGPFTAEDTAQRFPGNQGRPCPFGQPGDRLWVRETWWHYRSEELEQAGFTGATKANLGDGRNSLVTWNDDFDPNAYPHVWRKRPSIHMPRWASRLTLEIVSVRVERVQAITEEDARAEGITDGGCLNCGEAEPCVCAFPTPSAREGFIGLWDSINGKREGCAWADNPWCWRIEFKRVEGAA